MPERVKLTRETLPSGRALVHEYGHNRPFEVEVIEWSPSGDYVKLKHHSGDAWTPSGLYIIAEVLDVVNDDDREDWRPHDAQPSLKHRRAAICRALISSCNGLAMLRANLILMSTVSRYATDPDVDLDLLCGMIAAMQPTGYDPRIAQEARELQADLAKGE